MNDYMPLTACVACGSERLKKYFDAGEQPLANAFHDPDEILPTFPLGLNLCLDCGHSQNLGVVNPDLIFKNYPYVSGTTQTLRDYFLWFADKVEDDYGHYAPLRILEIGCNDGTLLKEFADRGHQAFGVDPAKNLPTPDGVMIERGYWNAKTAVRFSRDYPLFDAIVAMNVFGHVASPLSFIRACKKVLSPNGRIYIQVSQTRMIKNGEFDTCYHEHVSFFEDSSFIAIGRRSGLYPAVVHVREIHGGSKLVEFVLGSGEIAPEIASPHIDDDIYGNFERRAQQHVSEVNAVVDQYRADGYSVIGFGAAAKANTFLNYGKIKLDYMVDENPLKHGKLTPGMNIPVRSTNVLSSEPRKILFVITAWNFRDEIMDKIKRLRPGFNDAYMVYFPKLEIA
jgi:SAM-dependent methyltransferase